MLKAAGSHYRGRTTTHGVHSEMQRAWNVGLGGVYSYIAHPLQLLFFRHRNTAFNKGPMLLTIEKKQHLTFDVRVEHMARTLKGCLTAENTLVPEMTTAGQLVGLEKRPQTMMSFTNQLGRLRGNSIKQHHVFIKCQFNVFRHVPSTQVMGGLFYFF